MAGCMPREYAKIWPIVIRRADATANRMLQSYVVQLRSQVLESQKTFLPTATSNNQAHELIDSIQSLELFRS